MPPAQLLRRYSGIALLQNGDDLFFPESSLPHDSSSSALAGHRKWRSHISNGLISGEQVRICSSKGVTHRSSRWHYSGIAVRSEMDSTTPIPCRGRTKSHQRGMENSYLGHSARSKI